MTEMRDGPAKELGAAQAAELSLLVDLEAHWENLRTTPSRTQDPRTDLQELRSRQGAYEAFRVKAAAYNKRYSAQYVPKRLVNTPRRLAVWCREMRDLYRLVENDPRGHCPVHLLERAGSVAEQLGARVGAACPSRPTVPTSIAAAVRDLEALAEWCDRLGVGKPAATGDSPATLAGT